MPYHTVEQGECIESIAFQYGLFWETVWNDPQNAGLRALRKEHNVLLPGDQVFVPDLRPRQESCATAQRHRFVRKGVPSKLQVRLLFNGLPRANLQYMLRVDGALRSGTTDDNGFLETAISPKAKKASLILLEAGEQEEYTIDLGYLDPGSELTGVQGRLANLGFACEPTGTLDEPTEAALRSFQEAYGLEVNGQLDQATREKILEVHDARLGAPATGTTGEEIEEEANGAQD